MCAWQEQCVCLGSQHSGVRSLAATVLVPGDPRWEKVVVGMSEQIKPAGYSCGTNQRTLSWGMWGCEDPWFDKGPAKISYQNWPGSTFQLSVLPPKLWRAELCSPPGFKNPCNWDVIISQWDGHTLRAMGPQKPGSPTPWLVYGPEPVKADVKKGILCPLFPERQKSCHLSRDEFKVWCQDLGNF